MSLKSFEFQSFFMGGFECADHINREGIRINIQEETEHHLRVLEDYQLLKSIEITVVREGICWSSIEKEPYVFDFSRLKPFYEAAAQLEIQIIWDLCHFGFPSDLFPTHPQFVSRFKALTQAFCDFHSAHSNRQLLVIPINEISFLSWLSGEAKGTVPFTTNTGWQTKYALCNAAIKSIKTIKNVLPDAVIILAEPLIKVHKSGNLKDSDYAERFHEYQYQTADIILGRSCPELGGSEDLIDFLGVNYYYNNQWKDTAEMLPWPDVQKERTPLSALLNEVFSRYQLPLIITETGHFGKLRSHWIREICSQIRVSIAMGVAIEGVCIYPIIDRPDWDDVSRWHAAGIWDLDLNLDRIPYLPYLRTMHRLQNQFLKNHKVMPN